MSQDKADKLFRYDAKNNTKCTNNETYTSLRQLLCKEFVEQNNGQLNVESIQGSGTTSLSNYLNIKFIHKISILLQKRNRSL